MRANIIKEEVHPIVLVEVYSRSGGTLINKCLGALPNVVVMSEVCSFGGGDGIEKDPEIMTVKGQARRWYGIELKTQDFQESVRELHKFCLRNNRNLIIRDWVHALFNPTKFNSKPPKSFETLQLLKEIAPVNAIGFVRNAIDVWISSRMPNLKEFTQTYSLYVNALIQSGIPIFRYEDFTNSPEEEMKKICEVLDLEFSVDFMKDYRTVKAHGDSRYKDRSRGIKSNGITPLKRKFIHPKKVLEIGRNSNIRELNSLLGYGEESYFRNFNEVFNYSKNLVTSYVK